MGLLDRPLTPSKALTLFKFKLIQDKKPIDPSTPYYNFVPQAIDPHSDAVIIAILAMWFYCDAKWTRVVSHVDLDSEGYHFAPTLLLINAWSLWPSGALHQVPKFACL
ncbi:hypothetical protein COLO4_34575 [Corchorus olitorius]|uniref:Uncharacterized protein n=1 Tax=Corchorus olitorius TaxID=93759 RepID=A0A1R3GKD8_9ROSI|nr:hypothetical protein COLO4_34575 [Corchorus olitorius]